MPIDLLRHGSDCLNEWNVTFRRDRPGGTLVEKAQSKLAVKRLIRIIPKSGVPWLSIFLQALEVDPGASQGISFTRGLRLVFGS